jgi:hypothetical protein
MTDRVSKTIRRRTRDYSEAKRIGVRPRLGLDYDVTGIIVITTSIEWKSVLQGPHDEPNNRL